MPDMPKFFWLNKEGFRDWMHLTMDRDTGTKPTIEILFIDRKQLI